ncbi:MAG TPA: tRNA uridine-5-carboxymethylaminomethyl(34) synthesis GTPase MnmE [Blastocatellia bacterium]|nr:tRNA uridine-5-carboxymethylaminomethyl(34) synthesis GTPase MnmE [Blastocatellia bacterium]
MFHGDTIAAISTPPGRGGIGIVRLSGPDALTIAGQLFCPTGGGFGDPNRATYGRIIDPELDESADVAVAVVYRAPHSYTGEDIVELSCHGSPIILSGVLELALARGARLAEPGEFTMRAFLNRKLDLLQAQAVRDLIEAQTTYQARLASRQLEGRMSKRLNPLKQTVIDVIVHLESAVEFVEDDISTEAATSLAARLAATTDELNRIAATFSFGRLVRDGFDLAIAGRPNVGKSSVFNRLVGTDRAIVTEIPGTTRDALYETTSIAGLPVRLIDTAGIRETTDRVETMGIERSRTAIADADLSLLVLDGSESLTQDDSALLAQVPPETRIVVVNKTDLPRKLADNAAGEADCICVSALTGSGFDELTDRILKVLAGDSAAERDGIMLTDARQQQAVRRAAEQLSDATTLLGGGELEEIVLLKLRGALEALGEVTGETLTDDILSRIFSTFCIGK